MRLLKYTFPSVLIGLLFFAYSIASAQPNQDESDSLTEVQETSASLGIKEVIILGLVEGVTEFLPVSSTAHLILTNKLLGLDSEELIDGSDKSVKSVVDAYTIIIQIGAIFAVIVVYWNRIWQILLGLMGFSPIGRRLAKNIFIAFLPAAVLGLLLDSWIEYHLFAPLPIAIALIFGGLLMISVEEWRRAQSFGDPTDIQLDALGTKQCLMIGILQSFAMWPGLSRSMITIVGGYIAGLSPVRAAEFSFLLGLVTLSAASGYKMMTHGSDLLLHAELSTIFIGILVSFVSAAFAVKWMVHYLTRHGLRLFAYYRFIIGALVIYFMVI